MQIKSIARLEYLHILCSHLMNVLYCNCNKSQPHKIRIIAKCLNCSNEYHVELFSITFSKCNIVIFYNERYTSYPILKENVISKSYSTYKIHFDFEIIQDIDKSIMKKDKDNTYNHDLL